MHTRVSNPKIFKIFIMISWGLFWVLMAPKSNNESNLQLEIQIYRNRLRCLFAIIKFFIFSIAILSALFLTPYNSSISILISKWPPVSKVDDFLRFFLIPFASWDGAYFLKIAMEGYTAEPNYAFFPLFPLLMRLSAEYLFRIFEHWLSLITRCMLSGVLISLICHGLSARLLFWITMEMFGNAYFSFLSTAFFIINPASAYLTSMYLNI
jgi:Gpi18-like mannosyltransferase